MRCPHCAGEIPAGSRFCGICGRGIDGGHADEGGWPARAEGQRGEAQVDSVSLFELPASRGGRRAKLALILMLDAILAGAGVVMLLSYLESRRENRHAAPAGRRPDDRERGKVEVLAPTKVTPPRPAPGAMRPGSPGSVEKDDPTGPSESAPANRPAPKPPAEKPRSRPGKSKSKTTDSRSSSGGAREAGSGALHTESQDGADAGAGEPAVSSGDEPLGGEVAPEAADDAAQIDRVTARLRRVVDGHQAELEQCYLSAANSADPGKPLEGRIDIRFTLMSDGSAAHINPTGNSTGSSSLADCVVDLIKSWKFPPGLAEPLELEWPFLFRAPVETAQQ